MPCPALTAAEGDIIFVNSEVEVNTAVSVIIPIVDFIAKRRVRLLGDRLLQLKPLDQRL
jgi:hypothetical protein